MSTHRDSNYEQQPNYEEALLLVKQIVNDTSSKCSIISQIRHVFPNTYVRHLGGWLPLVHYCMTLDATEVRQSCVKELIKVGADVKRACDGTRHILFLAQSKYLTYLVKMGVFINDSEKQSNILHALRASQVQRLEELELLGVIKVTDLITSAGDTPHDLVSVTIKYLMYLFNIREGIDNKKEALDKHISLLLNSLTYLFSRGVKRTDQYIKLCADNYLYELLQPDDASCESVRSSPPQYHAFMDGLTVSHMRPLFNDRRYVKTCELLQLVCDPDVYRSING